jgi:hypothetical protein
MAYYANIKEGTPREKGRMWPLEVILPRPTLSQNTNIQQYCSHCEEYE